MAVDGSQHLGLRGTVDTAGVTGSHGLIDLFLGRLKAERSQSGEQITETVGSMTAL